MCELTNNQIDFITKLNEGGHAMYVDEKTWNVDGAGKTQLTREEAEDLQKRKLVTTIYEKMPSVQWAEWWELWPKLNA